MAALKPRFRVEFAQGNNAGLDEYGVFLGRICVKITPSKAVALAWVKRLNAVLNSETE